MHQDYFLQNEIFDSLNDNYGDSLVLQQNPVKEFFNSTKNNQNLYIPPIESHHLPEYATNYFSTERANVDNNVEMVFNSATDDEEQWVMLHGDKNDHKHSYELASDSNGSRKLAKSLSSCKKMKILNTQKHVELSFKNRKYFEFCSSSWANHHSVKINHAPDESIFGSVINQNKINMDLENYWKSFASNAFSHVQLLGGERKMLENTASSPSLDKKVLPECHKEVKSKTYPPNSYYNFILPKNSFFEQNNFCQENLFHLRNDCIEKNVSHRLKAFEANETTNHQNNFPADNSNNTNNSTINKNNKNFNRNNSNAFNYLHKNDNLSVESKDAIHNSTSLDQNKNLDTTNKLFFQNGNVYMQNNNFLPTNGDVAYGVEEFPPHNQHTTVSMKGDQMEPFLWDSLFQSYHASQPHSPNIFLAGQNQSLNQLPYNDCPSINVPPDEMSLSKFIDKMQPYYYSPNRAQEHTAHRSASQICKERCFCRSEGDSLFLEQLMQYQHYQHAVHNQVYFQNRPFNPIFPNKQRLGDVPSSETTTATCCKQNKTKTELQVSASQERLFHKDWQQSAVCNHNNEECIISANPETWLTGNDVDNDDVQGLLKDSFYSLKKDLEWNPLEENLYLAETDATDPFEL